MTEERSKHPDKKFYEWDLVVQLGTCIDLYEEDREAYSTRIELTDPEQVQLFQQAECFAKALLQGADDLVSGKPPNGQVSDLVAEQRAFWNTFKENRRKLADFVKSHSPESVNVMLGAIGGPSPPEDHSPLKLAWERLCIVLGREGVEKIDEGASRLLLLWHLFVQADPPRPTLQYLHRVSRCFVWRFDTECVILCRSVLDTAFREAVPEGQDLGLSKRIRVARQIGLISKDLEKTAFKVMTRGDKAVHGEPYLVADVLGTIRDTLLVVRQLTGGDDGG